MVRRGGRALLLSQLQDPNARPKPLCTSLTVALLARPAPAIPTVTPSHVSHLGSFLQSLILTVWSQASGWVFGRRKAPGEPCSHGPGWNSGGSKGMELRDILPSRDWLKAPQSRETQPSHPKERDLQDTHLR